MTSDSGALVEVVLSDVIDGGGPPWLISLLDTEERDRLGALARTEDRARFLSMHALLRVVIASRTGQRPEAVRFERLCRICGATEGHGKPALAGCDGAQRLWFSVASSERTVAVGVTRIGAIGVDIEACAAFDSPALDEVALHERERAVLATFPESDRRMARATAWVRKEAVLKATGHGLAVMPSHLCVSRFDELPTVEAWEGPVRPLPGDGPVHIRDIDVGRGYRGAVAWIGGDGDARSVGVRTRDGTSMLRVR